VWTLPPGAVIIDGEETNVITVSFGSVYTGGNITVSAVNGCGTGPARVRATSLNLPSTPGSISGVVSGLCNKNGLIYSISPVAGVTSYNWILPSGVTLVSGAGTTSITVNYGTVVGSAAIQVQSVNACGVSAFRSLSLSGAPPRPGLISGNTAPCFGSTESYNIATVDGADFYDWAGTSGGIITAAPSSKIASVAWGIGVSSSQVITVKARNGCGSSTNRTRTITLTSCAKLAEMPAQQNVVLYPNPANDLANLNFISENGGRYIIQVIDMSGRTILEEGGSATAGSNTIPLEIGGLESGIYNVILMHENNKGQSRLFVQ
jgi:hypothetical protein